MPLVEVDRRTNIPIATVGAAVVPKGQIREIAYYDYTTDTYTLDAPPTVPLGNPIGARLYAQNTHVVNQNMRLDATVRHPDGVTESAQGSVLMVPPGLRGYWDLLLQPNKVGAWSATLVLLAELA